MNIQEYHQLQADRATLERLLDQLPTTSVIERMGLEARKREIEDAIASHPSPSREPVHARLTFSGKPIVGSHGMFAEFGAAVIKAFTDVIVSLGASQSDQLGARGAIPNREEFQLLITGTALGSFGFELEEAPKDGTLFPEMSIIEPAIEQAKSILEASLGTDDELTEAISEADPRALLALRDFLKKMEDNEAICALEFKGEVFRFEDVGQIRRSESRLSQENIHEEDINIAGQFLGVLPKHRTFEFLVKDTSEVISGKVGPCIPNASDINRILEKPATIKAHTKKVGTGNARYMLLEYKPITENEKK